MKTKIKISIVIVAFALLTALASVSLAEQPSQNKLSVHVVDKDGTPIPWGVVDFRQEQEDKNYISIGWQKVNKNGIASMTVPDGVYSVVASASGNPVSVGKQIKVTQDEDVYLSFYMKLRN